MVKVVIVDRKQDTRGNPVYRIFIEGVSKKIDGLRKLKAPNMYSIQSFSLEDDLNRALKPKKVKLVF